MSIFRTWTVGLILAMMVMLRAVAGAEDQRQFLRLKMGDDPRWAAPNWNDSDWKQVGFTELPGHTGIFWIRFKVNLASEPVANRAFASRAGHFVERFGRPPSPVDSVFLAAVFSYELFWDGRLVAQQGVVGSSKSSEVTGKLDNLISIPSELLGPGDHVVALRMSNWHNNFPEAHSWLPFQLGNYAQRADYEARRPILPMMGTCCALLAAAVCGILYYSLDRRPSLLVCGLLCLTIAVFYLLFPARALYDYPYEWHHRMLLIAQALITLIGVLLPWLFIEQFTAPPIRWPLLALVPIYILVWLAVPIPGLRAHLLCLIMFAFGLGIALRALWQKKPGARLALVAVLAGIASVEWAPTAFLGTPYLLAFGAIVVVLFATLAVQVRSDFRRAHTAVITAARLEIELLKKHIQPHFLLNTLSTIVGVIEQEPKTAVTLIEALADEFRILAHISGEKLISLGHELDLCRSHLTVMSLRRAGACTLNVQNVDLNAQVPPALFHTLIENGLTHQQLPASGSEFRLRGHPGSGGIRYEFTAPGISSRSQDRPKKTANGSAEAAPREGTGLRYVKMRLEESFPGRWSIEAGPVADGWRTMIEIRSL